MNRRIFLFGLGLGIIIGAALLQLMIIGEKQVNLPEPIAQDGSEQVTYTQEELDKAVADARKRAEEELKQKQPVKQQEPPQSADKQTSESAPAKEEKKDDKTNANAKAKAEAKPTVVRIPPNSSVTATADILKAKGVITDKQAFIDLMRNTKLRAGYFAFKAGLSLEQVRNVITSKPNASAADLPASDK